MANIQSAAITTTTVTVDQTILTYTPAAGLKLKCIVIVGYPTAYSAAEVNMGTVYVQVGGVQKLEFRIQNTDLDSMPGLVVIPFGDGLSFTGSEAVRVSVTPASTTSFRWAAMQAYQ